MNASNIIWLIITGIVILLPIVIGVINWKKMPDKMAIHFGTDGKPNGYAPKGFVVFGIPLLLLLTQLVVFFAFILTKAPQLMPKGNIVLAVALLIIPVCGIVTFVIIYKKALKG